MTEDLPAEIMDTINPIVDEGEGLGESKDVAEMIWRHQSPVTEQNMDFNSQGDDETLRAGAVCSRIGREMGYGDFCFGRLLGSDRQIQVCEEKKLGQQEWDCEDFQAGSGNVRFKEIGSFERYDG